MVLNKSGSPQRSQFVEKRQVVATDPKSGHGNDASAHAESFAAAANLSAPPLLLDAIYADSVLKLKSWDYWRFETMADAAVPDEVAGRPPLRASSPMQLSGVPDKIHSTLVDVARNQTLRESQPGRADPIKHVSLLELMSQQRQPNHRPAAVRFLHRWSPGDAGGDNLFPLRRSAATRS